MAKCLKMQRLFHLLEKNPQARSNNYNEKKNMYNFNSGKRTCQYNYKKISNDKSI